MKYPTLLPASRTRQFVARLFVCLLALVFFSQVTRGQTCVAPSTNLVGWWAAESNTFDNLGLNNGAAQGNLSYTAGEVGQAFQFDGSTAFVSVPASASLNVGTNAGITIEAWIKPVSLTTTAPLAEWNNGSNSFGPVLSINLSPGFGGGGPGSLYANFVDVTGTGHVITTGTNLLSTSNFNHVAVTYDHSTGMGTIYLNGTNMASQNLGIFSSRTTYNLILGSRPGSFYYGGLMDELSIYNTVLTSNQIQAIYNAGNSGKCAIRPVIAGQPQNTNVITGSSATFRVNATGSQPLSYQWRLNNTNISVLTNATAASASLVLNNVQLSQSGGIYSVIVTNSTGSTNSTNAMLTVNPPPCSPAASSLTSWWRAEGDATDNLGSNNGTLVGGVTFAPGEVGQAFNFDGTSGYVLIPASSSLNVAGPGTGLTVEGWIKPAALASLEPLAEWNDGAGNLGPHFWINVGPESQGGGPGSLFANIVDTSAQNHIIASAANVVSTNSFNHVAITYDKTSGTAVLYCNGAVVASGPLGAFTPRTSFDLYLGHRPGPGGSYFYGGLLDEFSVYNTALSSGQIQAIYAAGITGKCPAPAVIASQPQSQVVIQGHNTSFSVSATGSQPLAYQWRLNNTNISTLTNVTATNATLVLTNLQLSQSGGLYSVMISNVGGSTNSSNAMLTVNPPPPCAPPPAGLVSWWPGEGNANDFFGTNNGTLVGGAGFGPGEVGQAFAFNGTSQYVDVPNYSTLNPTSGVTIEAWVYQQAATQGAIVKKAGEGTTQVDGYALEVDNPGPTLLFGVYTTGGWGTCSAPTPFPLQQWVHVAGAYDGTNLYLYTNGVLAATPVPFSGPIIPSGNHLNIGHDASSPTGNFFNGLIDEASIYGAGLTASQIQAVYNAGGTGKCVTAPVIASQPQGQTVSAGNYASLNVAAAGPAPLSYQWQINASNIPGATNPSLTFLSAQTSNTGNYSVIVSNLIGPTFSSNAFLNVVAPTCLAAPTNLVGWWQGEGDAADSVGLNNGALLGTIGFFAGKVGQAFNFTGTNPAVQIAASSALNVGTNAGLSIEAWINPANLSTLQPLAEWNNGAGSLGPHFWINVGPISGGTGPGSLFANIVDTGGNNHIFASGTNLLVPNIFNHVALTYDKSSGTAAIYVNGTNVASQNLGSFTPRTTYSLFLGERASFTPLTNFSGLMDETSLYSRALSAAEIQALYNASTVGKCPTPPSFVSQPQSQSVFPGTNVVFTAGVAGSRPMTYRWTLNNSTLAGTNLSLPFTNVQPSQAGTYSLFVSNALNTATSSNAVLKVNVVTVLGNGQVLTNSQYAFAGSVTISLQNFYTNGAIFYTLNGSTPTAGSPQYTGPFAVTNGCIVRALGYRSDFLQSGQSDPVTITILPVYPIVATTAGGGSISLNPTNGTYTNGTVVTLKAAPAAGWTFLQWLGDASGTNTNTTVTVTRPEFVQAVFGTTLATTAAPAGTGSVMLNPPGGLYPFGTTVILTAVPQPGNYFALWGNAANGSGSTNPLPFTILNPGQTVSTLFNSLNAGQVALAVAPIGRGKVSLNPAGTVFNTGQLVNITATPDAGQSFLGWSGDASGTQNPLPLTLNTSKTVFANFTLSNQLTFVPLTVRPLSEGFELTLTGEYGSVYRLDGSTNLPNWVPLITLTNSFGTMQYIDTGTATNALRFYRGVLLP